MEFTFINKRSVRKKEIDNQFKKITSEFRSKIINIYVSTSENQRSIVVSNEHDTST